MNCEFPLARTDQQTHHLSAGQTSSKTWRLAEADGIGARGVSDLRSQ